MPCESIVSMIVSYVVLHIAATQSGTTRCNVSVEAKLSKSNGGIAEYFERSVVEACREAKQPSGLS